MFFGKKEPSSKCPQCKSKVDDSFSFCPYCGKSFADPEKELRDFGMIGRSDFSQKANPFTPEEFGITDKLISSLVNNLTKTLNQQLNEMNNAEIENFPNGIKIKIGTVPTNVRPHARREVKKVITEEQINRMSSLPRAEAKTSVRRFSDKVVYEMAVPGLESAKDVFISKLESGYEIKAIGSKKVYVNSLPINLPIHGYAIENGRLFVEFKTQEH